MKLLVTTMCRNEEKIIPYFIHHYSKIADGIFILDHQSTDNTVKIAQETAAKLGCGLQIAQVENNGWDDVISKEVKESVYKNFRDQFQVVISCDTDEFFHHKDGLKEILKYYYNQRSGTFVIKPEGYQMTSDKFPDYDGKPITEIIKSGFRDNGFDKPLCFTTNIELFGTLGMHNAYHYHNGIAVLPITSSGIKLLHYKMLGLEYRLERIKNSANNLSERGKELVKNGVGVQLLANEESLTNEFNNWLGKSNGIDI